MLDPFGTIQSPDGELRPLAELTEVGTDIGRLIRVPSGNHARPGELVARPSRLHGVLKHTGPGWVYTDQSTNGTWVNRRKLERGEERLLRAGDNLAFGAAFAPVWRMVSTDPPGPFAHRPGDGRAVRLAPSGTLLPDEDAPIAEVFCDNDGLWYVEQAGVRSALGGGLTRLGTLEWDVHLPTSAQTVPNYALGSIPLEDLTLHLRRVRPESAEAWIEHPGGRSQMFRNEHWVVALALAEQQFEDGAPTMAYVDNRLVSDASGKPESHLATHISRIRKDLAAAGVIDARDAIDARGHGRRFTVRLVLHPAQ
jgi:FHA domain